MAYLDKIDGGLDITTASERPLAIELGETLKLAIPIALTQLGQIAMMTTDLAFIGRLGSEAVAAAALAHTIFFVSFTFGMGLVSAVAPLAAQAFGARQPHLVRRSLRVGFWAALLISLPMMALPFRGEQILIALGQSPEAARLAQQYLFGLAWSVLPGLWFLALRGFMSAINRPEPILWITLAAIPTNALLVYLLLYGEWGLPQLGLFGAGLATSIVNVAMFLAGLWFAVRHPPFRKYYVLGHLWRIDWTLMRKLIEIGAPISISFLLEYGVFGAAGLLMGVISTTALAAHQIALQIAAILFMVPFGISMAATVRVGHAVGRGDAPAVRRAGLIAIGLGIVFMSAMTLAVILGRFEIAQVFLGDRTDAAAELTATLLLVGATFFVCDGIQTIAAGSLRGMNDTRVPLLFATVSYWLVGFTLACGLGFWTPLGAVGVWIGLSCGTAVYAMLLLLRFRRLADRLALAGTAAAGDPASCTRAG
jgi:multidrug resistance protein, MATE family